jgi:hypothetical protein
VKEQQTQKKLFNLKRAVCIGGGILLVIVAWTLLVSSSKNATIEGEPLLNDRYLARYGSFPARCLQVCMIILILGSRLKLRADLVQQPADTELL